MAVHRIRRKPMSEINVVPYIDVMLVMLVIFMITAPLLTQGVNVELPKVRAGAIAEDSQEPLIISVDAEGRYYINIGDDANSTKQFLEVNSLSFPVLLDTDITVARRYGIPGTPTAFFIDKEGTIKVKVIGPFPSKAAIDSRLSEIMP